MRVLIIGAAGMLGGRLAHRLACDGVLGGEAIDSILLVDVVAPAVPPGEVPVDTVVCDIADLGTMCDLLTVRPQVIVDLAAVVSGEAELDFEKGYRVNLDGTRHLLEAVRTGGEDYRPRVVFSSSIAVFGPPFPDVIGDEQATTPATSYGTQKAITELPLADYSRRGFLDGIGVRLPTICVRPGGAEPGGLGLLLGHHPRAAQRAAGGAPGGPRRPPLVRLAARRRRVPRARGHDRHRRARCRSDRSRCPASRRRCRMRSKALRRVAGDRAVALIRDEPDELIARLVDGWPRAFDARRAAALGFVADAGFDEIVRAYVEEELRRPEARPGGGGALPASRGRARVTPPFTTRVRGDATVTAHDDDRRTGRHHRAGRASRRRGHPPCRQPDRPRAADRRGRRRARRDHVDPRHDGRQRRDQHARLAASTRRCRRSSGSRPATRWRSRP